MSVIKQPFQMLPFSTAIESQWRLRSDCFNDICDVPVIPKGKFIPFAIISDSDNVGQISLHCWDEPFSYIRTEEFTKNDCEIGEIGETLFFSKIYYSNISPLVAEQQAMNDSLYLIEGQQYVNNNGICQSNWETIFEDNFNNWESVGEINIPVGWYNVTAGQTITNNNNRLDITIPSSQEYLIRIGKDNIVDFGNYETLKITINVDSISPSTGFDFAIWNDNTGSLKPIELINGINEILLNKGSDYSSSWDSIMFINSISGSQLYPKNIIIDSIKIEAI